MAVMSKNSEVMQAKKDVVEGLKEQIQKASGLVVIDYRGLTVAQDTEFRAEFRKNNVEYKVIKNRMMKLALNELGYHEFDEALNGFAQSLSAMTMSLLPLKVVAESIKKFNKMEIKAGLADGKYATVDEVVALSKIPNKETLIGQLLGMLTSPMRSLAVVLNEHAKQLG